MEDLVKKLKKLKIELTFGCGLNCVGCTVKKETGSFKKADTFIRDNIGDIKLITHHDWMGTEKPLPILEKISAMPPQPTKNLRAV